MKGKIGLKSTLEEVVFGEPVNIRTDVPLENRLFSEIMMKIFKLEQSISDDETVGLQIGDAMIDLKECRLIQGAGLVLLSGIRLKVDRPLYQPDGVFLCVQPLSLLSLTLLVLPRVNATAPRRKIGFSIQGQELSPD